MVIYDYRSFIEDCQASCQQKKPSGIAGGLWQILKLVISENQDLTGFWAICGSSTPPSVELT
jgi:hypothetical protein